MKSTVQYCQTILSEKTEVVNDTDSALFKDAQKTQDVKQNDKLNKKRRERENMLKEKITIEIPTSFVEWYKLVAQYNDWTFDQTIQEALAADIEGDLGDMDETAKVLGSYILENMGLFEALWKMKRLPSEWQDLIKEKPKASSGEVKS
jgi:hypothetical protein